MRRGPKPAKSKVESKLPVARESAKDEDSRVRDLQRSEGSTGLVGGKRFLTIRRVLLFPLRRPSLWMISS